MDPDFSFWEVGIKQSSLRAGLGIFVLLQAFNVCRAEPPDVDSELCQAVGQGDYSAVKVWLEEGAQIDLIDAGRWSPPPVFRTPLPLPLGEGRE